MAEVDLVIRGGSLGLAAGPRAADLAVADGRIVAIESEIAAQAADTIDASGLVVLPGVVDAHVHLNDPGRSEWEGWWSGTRALAAGGATSCVEMPFNAIPPTTSGAAFDAKLAAAEGAAHVDFALWGGIVPGNADDLVGLANRGVAGFKAFMCDTGLDEFPGADDLTLYEGMARAAEMGLPVLVHAENQAITAGLAARAVREGRRGVRDYLRSRPAIAEIEAIARAIALAEQTGCKLHVVHVSTGRGLAMVAEARARIDVGCETCPHYLVLTEEDVERMGAVAKCSPPIRSGTEREALWAGLESGALPMVASDHSPASPELKQGADFFAIWGGIAGAQTMLELVLDEGHTGRRIPLERLVETMSGFPARRFGLPGKGEIAVGADADLALLDLSTWRTLSADELHYRHTASPFAGRRIRARVVRTLLRGTTVHRDGAIVGPPAGRFMRVREGEAAPAPVVARG